MPESAHLGFLSTIYIPQNLGRLVLHHAQKDYCLPYHIFRTTALLLYYLPPAQLPLTLPFPPLGNPMLLLPFQLPCVLVGQLAPSGQLPFKMPFPTTLTRFYNTDERKDCGKSLQQYCIKFKCHIIYIFLN